MSVTYELASHGVIWEKIGNQLMMANLDSGRYCNVHEHSGVLVWELIMAGFSQEVIHEKLSNYFENYDSLAIKQINEFLAKLVALNFISVVQGNSEKTNIINNELAEGNHIEKFTEPKLLTYDDIDTLLQLDPIDDQVEELMREYQ